MAQIQELPSMLPNYYLKKSKKGLKCIYDISEVGLLEFDDYDFLILRLSTWFDGDLQSDWEVFFDTFKRINFF